MKYCKIKYVNGKKEVDFGKTWGAMKEKDANASFMETGDGMYVIDIDSKKIPKKYKKWVQALGHPTVETKRGYHFYVKSKFKLKSQQNIFNDEKFKVDIRGERGVIFTDYWGNSKKIAYLKTGKILKDKKFVITKSLPDSAVVAPKERKNVEKRDDIGEMSKKEIKALVAKLDIKDYTDRDSWMATLASIYHGGGEAVKKIAMKWSKGDSDSFDEGAFNNVWSQLESGQFGTDITVGSLIHATIEPEDVFGDERNDKQKEADEKEEKKQKKIAKAQKKLDKLKGKKKPKKSKGGELFEGTMTHESVAQMREQVILFEGLISQGHHSVLYGASGTNKTTIAAWSSVELLKKHKDKKVLFFAFDSDDTHNVQMFNYAHREGVLDRFKLILTTPDNMKDRFKEMLEAGEDMDDYVIIFDTFKFLTSNVNDKNANKQILHWIKQLQASGASILTLAHSNKDGANFSGTAELSQDTDAMFVITREQEANGNITTTVKKDGRCRFNVPSQGVCFLSHGDGKTGAMFHKAILDGMRVDVPSEDQFEDSPETVANEDEVIKQLDEKKRVLMLKNKGTVKLLQQVIKHLNKKKTIGKPLPATIHNELNKLGAGTSKVSTLKLLSELDGTAWEQVVTNLDGKMKMTYKLL